MSKHFDFTKHCRNDLLTFVMLYIADGDALLNGNQIRDNISDARNAFCLPHMMTTMSSQLYKLYDRRTATLANSVTVDAHALQ